MKLFIDTGNLKDIENLVPLGIIDGITTNPSLLAKEPGDYRDILKKICQTVKGPTSAEVVATGRRACVQDAVVGRQEGERHSVLLASAGADCREGRGHVYQPVRRAAR